ncbi:MAG TPA: nuclear transport factor 2 family protein, partial [Puia sp.]
MKKWYVTLMLVALAAGAVVAQNRKPVEQGKEEKAVSVAVEALRKAMIDPDKAVLEKLTFPELSYGHSDGLI